MATTKARLAEQIRRITSGGYPSSTDRFQDEDIIAAIGNAANKILKTEVLNTSFGFDGESLPSGAVVATYENVPLGRYGKYSFAKLPAAPMVLPENMGVFAVYPHGEPENEFDPLPAGMFSTFIKERLVNPIAAQTYTAEQGRVVIHTDLVGAGVTGVDMKLCVLDMSMYGEDDILPVTPEHEQQIVTEVLQIFGFEVQTLRDTDVQPQLTGSPNAQR